MRKILVAVALLGLVLATPAIALADHSPSHRHIARGVIIRPNAVPKPAPQGEGLARLVSKQTVDELRKSINTKTETIKKHEQKFKDSLKKARDEIGYNKLRSLGKELERLKNEKPILKSILRHKKK